MRCSFLKEITKRIDYRALEVYLQYGSEHKWVKNTISQKNFIEYRCFGLKGMEADKRLEYDVMIPAVPISAVPACWDYGLHMGRALEDIAIAETKSSDVLLADIFNTMVRLLQDTDVKCLGI